MCLYFALCFHFSLPWFCRAKSGGSTGFEFVVTFSVVRVLFFVCIQLGQIDETESFIPHLLFRLLETL